MQLYVTIGIVTLVTTLVTKSHDPPSGRCSKGSSKGGTYWGSTSM